MAYTPEIECVAGSLDTFVLFVPMVLFYYYYYLIIIIIIIIIYLLFVHRYAPWGSPDLLPLYT